MAIVTRTNLNPTPISDKLALAGMKWALAQWEEAKKTNPELTFQKWLEWYYRQ